MSNDYEMMGVIVSFKPEVFQLSRFTNPAPEVPDLLFESQFYMYTDRSVNNSNDPIGFHCSFEGMFRYSYVESYTCL